jgi:hypothetical protein
MKTVKPGYTGWTVITFKPRFVPERLLGDLSNLWHLSRVPKNTRYERMCWVADEFHKAHPEISTNAAYKDLDGMLSFGGH